MNIPDIMEKGGIAMWPLLLLSILALSTIIERSSFWIRFLSKEKQITKIILKTASYDWDAILKTSQNHSKHPICNFLYTPLKLKDPDPEVFHLALESSADDELALMRQGDKLLEGVIALSPLLGLLGTVLGLIGSLGNIQISDLGTSSTRGVTLGIGEALISTAAGLIIAITSLTFYRIFQSLWFNKVRVFIKISSELDLIYQQHWLKINSSDSKNLNENYNE